MQIKNFTVYESEIWCYEGGWKKFFNFILYFSVLKPKIGIGNYINLLQF